MRNEEKPTRKGLVITTDDTMYVQEFGDPLYETVGKVVGGWIEKVSPKGLPQPFCFICNEEGLLKNLPLNTMGCIWYGTLDHGCPIVGNIVVMKIGFYNGERDIIGLEDDDIERVKAMVTEISEGNVKEVNPDENL